MATAPDYFDRDPEDDAEARRWVQKIKAMAERGELKDDSAYIAEQIAKVKRQRKSR